MKPWSWGNRRKTGFADAMIASFPDDLQPPEPLVRLFRWQEENGLDDRTEAIWCGLLDPDQLDYCMYVAPVDPAHIATWVGNADPAAVARLAPFVRTGGDGSYAALWRDDAGGLRIVHLPSGSGSTMLCVLSDDPVDFLRLLAIGYDEVCWPENFDKTPIEIYCEELAEEADAQPFVSRHRFRDWVEASFDVTVPRTASEIVVRTADLDANESDDPFWNWMRSIQGR